MERRAIHYWAVVASLLMAAAPSAEARGEDVKALANSYNAFGQFLYRELARKPGNVVLSPWSIGAAMAMVRSGARGETERQMAAALKHGKPREDIDRANAALLSILNGYDTTSRSDYCPKEMHWTGKRCEGPLPADRKCPFPSRSEGGVCIGWPITPSAKLATANALILAKYGNLISPEYKTIVREEYTAEVYEQAELGKVNAWVRRTTAGRIDRIIDKLDPEAAAVLLTAVYFKAAWVSAFEPAATHEDDFKLSTGQTVRVQMMGQEGSFRLLRGPSYSAIRLNYVQPALAMIIVLPKDVDGLGELALQLGIREQAHLLAALANRPQMLVSLSLPRFKTAFEAELIEPCRRAGMTLAFTDAADFSGMTGRKAADGGVKISQIRHHAIIEVAEEGTEAVAAAAVEMRRVKSRPPKRPTPVPFTVDHPFLFYVVDDASSAILFQGRVVDPLRW